MKSISINFDQSENGENTDNREAYIRKLEEIIFEYEKIILNDQNSIKDLQDRVYEYLGDALEKEEEFEALCE